MSFDLTRFETAVLAACGSTCPELADRAIHDGPFDEAALKRTALRAPALRLVLAGVPEVTVLDTGARRPKLSCGLMILTRDTAPETARAQAWRLGLALLDLVVVQCWDCAGVSPAEAVKLEALGSGTLDERGVSLVGIEWRQPIRLGAALDRELWEAASWPAGAGLTVQGP